MDQCIVQEQNIWYLGITEKFLLICTYDFRENFSRKITKCHETLLNSIVTTFSINILMKCSDSYIYILVNFFKYVYFYSALQMLVIILCNILPTWSNFCIWIHIFVFILFLISNNIYYKYIVTWKIVVFKPIH